MMPLTEEKFIGPKENVAIARDMHFGIGPRAPFKVGPLVKGDDVILAGVKGDPAHPETMAGQYINRDTYPVLWGWVFYRDVLPGTPIHLTEFCKYVNAITINLKDHGVKLTSNKIFRVTPQISSFKPSSGKVGTAVTITGVSLKQATAVTFGGVRATSFTANSDTQVTATLPTGAKTGNIGINTAGGSAGSSGIFTVSP